MSDLMSQIRNDDAANVKDSIEASLKSKVDSAINIRKQQVAAQMFNTDDEQESAEALEEEADEEEDEAWDDTDYEIDDEDDYDLEEDDEWLEGEAIEDGG
jgi:hypothetical protein